MGIGIHGKKTNNYREKPKQSRIFTPAMVGRKIYDILSTHSTGIITDIGCGNYNLSMEFILDPDVKRVIGIDKKEKNFICGEKVRFIQDEFFKLSELSFLSLKQNKPDIVLCNPPFNWESKQEKEKYKSIKKKYNSNLLPEIFLKRIFDVFGVNIPVVLFVPFGFLFNNRQNSERYKWLSSIQYRLSSVLYLPVDAFKDSDVMTHSCVTFWNFEGLKPVYFLENSEKDETCKLT